MSSDGSTAGNEANEILSRGDIVAKPNFQFEKRQKELAKKKKNEEKLKRKLEKNTVQPDAEANPEQTEPVPTEPASS